jgi:peroxiredoxin
MKNTFTKLNCRATILFLPVIFCFVSLAGKADGGYRIQIQIEGIPDSVCFLAHYFGDKTYLSDTAIIDRNGSFIFKGDSLLPGGIYIVAGQNNNKYFELLVDHDQHFKVWTTISGIPGNIEIKGSNDNALFYYYVNQNVAQRKEIELISQRMKSFEAGNDSVKILKDYLDDLYEKLNGFEDSIIRSNPQSFVSAVLKAKQEPELLPARYLENGKEDSVFAYQSYKQRYWNNLDPADARLLRTPLYHIRLKNYFENVVFQHPDSLIREADRFIERAGPDRETFKYAVWYLTYKFETSNIMGFDEIFVHMVDAYYAKGLAYWTDNSVVKSLMKRADELRNNLIGSQAPDLILLDTAGSFKSLYAIDAAYTIVFFYEYGCSHCLREISALQAWYPENPYGAVIFAVNTDTSLVEWRKFIRKRDLNWVHVNATRSITADYHGLYDIRVTPTIYLLDDRKKIIAKRLKTDQLMPFLEGYHKNQKF